MQDDDSDGGMPDDWTPPKPLDAPPADPIKRIEEEAEGTAIGDAAATLREVEADLLNLQRAFDDED